MRERLNFSQGQLSELIDVSLNQLASIEYQRTPLRYDIAWKLRMNIGVSLWWLYSGKIDQGCLEYDELPTPQATGLLGSALLSEVAERFHKPADLSGSRKSESKKLKYECPDVSERVGWMLAFRAEIENWIAHVPDNKVQDFSDCLIESAKKIIAGFPVDSGEKTSFRRDALMWARMRADVLARNAGNMFFQNVSFSQRKEGIDNAVSHGIIGSVKTEVPTWPQLKRDLKRLTAQHGEKSALAKSLGISRQVLGNWLSDDSQGTPNADFTLALLKWVRQQTSK